MNKGLRTANFIALGLLGAGIIGIAIAQPSSAILGAVNLIPFGMALIAARSNSSRLSAWAAIIFNGIGSLLYLSIAAAVALGLGGTPVAVPIALLVATPCVFNTISMANFLRRG